MPKKVSSQVLDAVQKSLERYESEVADTSMTPNTKKTYLLHALNFVRWPDDDFEPGSRSEAIGN